jgi:hypothetical protein
MYIYDPRGVECGKEDHILSLEDLNNVAARASQIVYPSFVWSKAPGESHLSFDSCAELDS